MHYHALICADPVNGNDLHRIMCICNKHSLMICRALAVTEGELGKAGEQIAQYQHANRDLTTQVEESRQQMQVIASTRHFEFVLDALAYVLRQAL